MLCTIQLSYAVHNTTISAACSNVHISIHRVKSPLVSSPVSLTFGLKICTWHINSQCSNISAGKRAAVQQCFDSPDKAADDIPDGSVDVFVSTYVLDILSNQDIEAVLCLADR